MSRSLSIYLDTLRFVAAVIVVLSHLWLILYPNLSNPWPAHQAVVVFFVLSGLVMAHAASRPSLSLFEYSLHRLSRLWSVAAPGALLSLVVWLLCETPSVAELLSGASRALISLGFLGEVWFFRIAPPLNAPFWSLDFEAWYYALFGAFIFLSGRKRVIALLALALLAGPKMLLLFPVWAAGAVTYAKLPRWSERRAASVLIATFVVMIAMTAFDLNRWIYLSMREVAPSVMWRLGQAQDFGGDWLFAPLVALNFAAAARLGRFAAPLYAFEQSIRRAAGHTLSIYIYHSPLLVLAFVKLRLDVVTGLGLVALCVLALSMITEHQLPLVRTLLRAAGRLRPVFYANPIASRGG